MMGSVRVPTGIKMGEPLEESIRKIDACVRNYGLEAVFERVREFRGYRWVGHVPLRENCACLACRLESHLFKHMEKGFKPGEPIMIVGGEIPRPIEKPGEWLEQRAKRPITEPLFTGREQFHRPKW